MNFLQIGIGEKTFEAKRGFLLIDENGKTFDPTKHSFNPLKGMDVRRARDFADILFPDKDLMTYRNGKRALVKMLLSAKRVDDLHGSKSDEDKEALAAVDDLLLSPLMRRVLCHKPNFSFRNRPIFARLNRKEMGDHDARILGALLIQQFRGQIILPDAGFYLRPFHTSLIREQRLMAGVNTLSELDDTMRQMCLLMPKEGQGCSYDDAVVLAQYECPFPPRTTKYNDFIREKME